MDYMGIWGVYARIKTTYRHIYDKTPAVAHMPRKMRQ